MASNEKINEIQSDSSHNADSDEEVEQIILDKNIEKSLEKNKNETCLISNEKFNEENSKDFDIQ